MSEQENKEKMKKGEGSVKHPQRLVCPSLFHSYQRERNFLQMLTVPEGHTEEAWKGPRGSAFSLRGQWGHCPQCQWVFSW